MIYAQWIIVRGEGGKIVYSVKVGTRVALLCRIWDAADGNQKQPA
jgi:hypothetical protein